MIEIFGTPPGGQQTWLVFFRPARPDWPDDMTAEEASALRRHFDQLQALTEAGTCVVAGPSLDAEYGLLVVDGLSQGDVVRRLEADAMVAAGFFRAEVRAFRLSLERAH
jgi:uncharacterized protein YciI